MNTTMQRVWLFFLVVLLATVSCTSSSSSSGDAQGDGKAESSGSNGQGDDGADPGDEDGGTGGSGSDSNGPTITASGRFASAVGKVIDPADDAQVTGSVPDFVEILEGSVHGSPESISLILEMSGEVPQTMPDETTYMIVAWNLAGSKKAPTVGISAQAGTDGWVVSAAVDNEPADWVGDLTIEGNAVELTMPWNFIGKPHAFDWSTSASYYATAGDEPSGSGDNISEGHFPDKTKKS